MLFGRKPADDYLKMRRYFILYFLLCNIITFAQSVTVTLSGTLTMETGEQFPYQITGTDSNGILTGFACTYAEPEQTKVKIKGRIDKQRHKLIFRETEIVSSHDVHTTAFMCLLHVSLENKNNMLTGPANGEESDNTACTPGTLTFSNSEEINNLFSNHDKYDMAVSMGGKKTKDTANSQKQAIPVPQLSAEADTKEDKITTGVEKTFDWHTDSIIVDVWDGGHIDGDMISISLDGKVFLSKYVIQRQKKRVVIPLPANGIHSLTIFADDEGSEPLNTASLTLTDGETRHNLLAYNAKGQLSLVRIKKLGGK